MTPGLRAAACLSLTGRFAQFGRQAQQGLQLWASESHVDLTVVDDASSPDVLAERMPALAAETDLLFGPYSTVLMKAAIPIAAAAGRLLFNHGGSGGALDLPGAVVNVLTPADRYAVPFVDYLALAGGSRLFTNRGKGAFGRDVIAGAEAAAHAAGLPITELDWDRPPPGDWVLLSAGVYEHDVAAVRRAQALATPPRLICSVAAGVASFAVDVDRTDGILGIGQWALAPARADVGRRSAALLALWQSRYGAVPDYPGVQAYAAGVIASLAARLAGTTDPVALWRTVAGLDVTTAFGRFAIDAATGVQVGHEAVLTQWRGGEQVPVVVSP